MQSAYYASDLVSFRAETSQTILGHLAEHHPHDLTPLQRMLGSHKLNPFDPPCALSPKAG